jgi:excisionase family DNA binding protein
MTAPRARQGPEVVASPKVAEKKYSINQAAKAIGISPSGVRLLLNNKKLGYYQSGKRKLIGEGHLQEYLSLAERKPSQSIR